jgi:hypothetical protein
MKNSFTALALAATTALTACGPRVGADINLDDDGVIMTCNGGENYAIVARNPAPYQSGLIGQFRRPASVAADADHLWVPAKKSPETAFYNQVGVMFAGADGKRTVEADSISVRPDVAGAESAALSFCRRGLEEMEEMQRQKNEPEYDPEGVLPQFALAPRSP